MESGFLADCACGPAAHPPAIFAQVFILLTLQHIAQRGKRMCGPDSHLLHKAQEVGHPKTKGRRPEGPSKLPRNSGQVGTSRLYKNGKAPERSLAQVRLY